MTAWNIPVDEVMRRLPNLARVFGEHVGEPVVVCRNVDTRYLPPAINGEPLPKPSIYHSVVKCHACDDDMWIGPPEQARQPGVARVCYICMSIVFQRCDTEPEIVALNPDADEIPRRT